MDPLSGLNPRLMFLAVFLSALSLFLFLDRKKIQRHYILFYRRTDRGLEIIDSIASRLPGFWKYYGWVGVLTGFLSIVASFALMAYTYGNMFATRSVENGPSLILPGLSAEHSFQAGVSFIPIEYWVISIGIIMVVHELSHGIVARAEDFEINSVGWIVMGIFPGAFVEPKGENMLPGEEENEDASTGMWEQGTWKQRLKVLGAGSFANYITAAVFILGALGMSAAVTQPSGLLYVTEEGFPAHEAGMNNGTINQISGEKIDTVDDLQRVSGDIEVGEPVKLWTSEGNFTIEAGEKEGYEGGYIGIRVGKQQVMKPEYESYQAGLQWFISLLQTVAFLNFVIGLFNMLPLKPLDGGLMIDTLIKEYAPERENILNSFSLAGWALILAGLAIGVVVGL